ncbi:alpha/beta-hydrolase [Aureobasidium pullulans]|uniref:Alpha/beta-hydrolase n=1 Tax=Aureobasidium pullulans TaxID=5580 RepID=A0A4S9L4Q3_AURPU|nr:alpha/beta-hydrolase [Aureobasidium pullulans]
MAVLEAHRAFGITNFENATVHPPRGGAAICVSGIVQVQAMTTKNLKFDYVSPQNQSQVAELTLDMLTVNSSFIEDIVIGTQSVNGTFGIGATLCLPANSRRPAQVQFLTHGFGFDRYYWDFASGYSWVDVAAQYDHATFFYDRLGVGESDTPGALDVVQAPLQVEIAHQLVERLKSGHFGIAFPTVVGVGHSLGSAITQGLTSQYPADLDATILTGFSLNATGQGTFLSGLNLDLASANAPHRFASAPPGYLVSSSVISNQIAFFRAPGFDPAILDLVEATKATGTVGEFFSLGSVIVPAVQYDRPVAIINGVNDLPFCFGNCNYPTNLAQGILPVLYPSSTKTGTYLAQAAGHGLNQHFSASKAYHYAQKFLAQVL